MDFSSARQDKSRYLAVRSVATSAYGQVCLVRRQVAWSRCAQTGGTIVHLSVRFRVSTIYLV